MQRLRVLAGQFAAGFEQASTSNSGCSDCSCREVRTKLPGGSLSQARNLPGQTSSFDDLQGAKREPFKLCIAPEVAAALSKQQPVVALESTIISHGARPDMDRRPCTHTRPLWCLHRLIALRLPCLGRHALPPKPGHSAGGGGGRQGQRRGAGHHRHRGRAMLHR